MNRILQDIRFEFRLLLRSPVVGIVTVLTFALGIGANTVFFSILKAVILRPLPGTYQAEKLVTVTSITKAGKTIPLSYPLYKDLRDQNQVFTQLAASAMSPMSLSTGGPAERIWGELVTGNYFESLGTGVVKGRAILPDDTLYTGSSPVAVISYSLWQKRFGGDPGIIGQKITLNNYPFTIVGVAEPSFHGSLVGVSLDAFVPVTMQSQVFGYAVRGDILNQREAYWLITQGHLKPGITLAQAQAPMNVFGENYMKAYPSDGIAQRAVLIPLWRSPFGAQTYLLPLISGLLVVGFLVLAIACVNIANILLARVTQRAGEMAIRLALGISRTRLFVQVLSSTIVLAVVGALGGIAVASWANGFIVNRPGPGGVPVALNSGIDGLVFAFSMSLVLFSSILVGILPAVRVSRVSLMYTLNREAGGRVAARSWLRRGLVVSQIAISLVLLISAALLIQSFARERNQDPGFNPANALLATIDLKAGGRDQDSGWAFCRQLLQAVRESAGVEDTTLTWQLPLSGFGDAAPSAGVMAEGYLPGKQDADMVFHYNVVGPDYLRSMGIRLLYGREFTARDDAENQPVIMINETMARRFWPGQNPIGRRILTSGVWRNVVGVAQDSKYSSITEDPQPYFYLPYFQSYQPQVILQVRTKSSPLMMQSSLLESIHKLDPTLPAFNVKTLERQVDTSFARIQQVAALLSAAGVIGLVLAIIGVYGLMAQHVAQEIRSFGIRMALGARSRDIFLLVLRRGMYMMLAGELLGVIFAFAGTRFLRGMLYHVNPLDPVTLGGVAFLFGLAILTACWIPAYRAGSTQPVEVLRHQ